MLTRRNFVGTAIASAAGLSTSGCLLFGLFRLGARGSLIRTGARASRRNTQGALTTFGRSGASTLHLARLTNSLAQLNRMRRVGQLFRIEDPQERELVGVDCDGKSAECKVDEVPITVTHPDGSWLVHHSNLFRESVGASRGDDDVLRHEDTKGRIVGYDVFEGNSATGRIRHFNKDRNLVGATTFRYVEGGAGVRAVIDDGQYLEAEMRRAIAGLQDDYGKGLRYMGDATAAQAACIARRGGTSCDDLTAVVKDALERLERG